MASSNGEKVWNERIKMFIVLSIFLGGVLTFVFVTRGELHAAMLTKADKVTVEEHTGEEAHREQKVINKAQAKTNADQEEINSAWATGLKRMELLMIEQMVASGQLDRATIRRILNKVPR